MSNILVLTYFSYKDALVQTYTLPYVRIIRKKIKPGQKVFLFTLEKNESSLGEPDKKNEREKLANSGIEWISAGYDRFGLRMALKWCLILPRLWWCILRNDVKFIHCWATPAAAAGYMLSIFSDTELFIDSYEPHAEAMVENGTWTRKGLAFRLLFALEKISSRKAKLVIAGTWSMREYAAEKYGIVVDRFYVKPACVDMDLFSLNKSRNKELQKILKLEEKIVCVYAGKIGGIYLDREIFDFFKVAFDKWGDKFRALILTSHTEEEIEKLCIQASLDSSCLISAFVPHDQIPQYLGLADFACTFVKSVPSKRHCTPIKDGEYWAMGLPVVITRDISDDSDIIQKHNVGAVLHELNSESYRIALNQIEFLLSKPRAELSNEIREIARKYRSFDIAEKVYEDVYGKN